MRTIITGGSGTIGTTLSSFLANDGYDVIVLSRNPEAKGRGLPSRVRAVHWDGKTPNGWAHLLDHHDTVIVNLAGHSIATSGRWTAQHKERVLRSRIDATQAVVTAIQQAEHKPRALIQGSAMGYYGDGGETVLTEDSPPSDEWRSQVCQQWEQSAADAGTRTVYLRIGVALDMNGGALPAFLVAAHMMGSRLGPGDQWIPWIHNYDVAAAIHFLMTQRHLSGAFNLVAPNPMRNHAFMKLVGKVRGRPSLIPVPAMALYATIGEQALFILDSQRAAPERLLNAGFKFHYPDAESALREILSHPRKKFI